jgi:hypothetical protein
VRWCSNSGAKVSVSIPILSTSANSDIQFSLPREHVLEANAVQPTERALVQEHERSKERRRGGRSVARLRAQEANAVQPTERALVQEHERSKERRRGGRSVARLRAQEANAVQPTERL